MTGDWLQAAIGAVRRNGHCNVVAGAAAGLGAAIAIGAMEGLSRTSHYPLVIIPFATSIKLVIGSPEAEPAQPRALIGGHVVATLVGLATLWITAARLGSGRRRRTGRSGDGGDRNVSSAGRDQSLAGGRQQPALVIFTGPGTCRRRAADGVCLYLAPLGPSPALAAALVVESRCDHRLTSSPRSRRANWSPSRISTTWR
jgi:hypothetical protein